MTSIDAENFAVVVTNNSVQRQLSVDTSFCVLRSKTPPIPIQTRPPVPVRGSPLAVQSTCLSTKGICAKHSLHGQQQTFTHGLAQALVHHLLHAFGHVLQLVELFFIPLVHSQFQHMGFGLRALCCGAQPHQRREEVGLVHRVADMALFGLLRVDVRCGRAGHRPSRSSGCWFECLSPLHLRRVV